MDEQKIIINNIDVSECEFFEECEIKIDDSECLAHSRHFYEGTFYDCCDEHPNCYYKQLKRLEFKLKVTEADYEASEQECEELKKCLLQVQNVSISLNKQLDKLKAEKEILKEKLVISSNSDKKTLKIIQTLAEIKNIAETISLPMGTGKSGNRVILAKQILQKISEVELNGTNP